MKRYPPEAAQTIYQAVIDAELTAVIGAGPWEHSAERTGLRNGWPKVFSTQAGDMELSIPKLSSGSFYPSLNTIDQHKKLHHLPGRDLQAVWVVACAPTPAVTAASCWSGCLVCE